jgi:hypothetical protein
LMMIHPEGIEAAPWPVSWIKRSPALLFHIENTCVENDLLDGLNEWHIGQRAVCIVPKVLSTTESVTTLGKLHGVGPTCFWSWCSHSKNYCMDCVAHRIGGNSRIPQDMRCQHFLTCMFQCPQSMCLYFLSRTL